MPDTSSDDQFADLFGKLPDPRDRESATRTVPSADASAEQPAPSSRRAARLASQGAETGEAASAVSPGSAATAGSETPAPLPPAPTATPSAAGTARPDRSSTPTARPGGQSGSLEALFTGDVSTDSIGRVPPPKDRRRRRRGGWIALAIVVVVLGGIAAGGAWVWNTYEDKIRAVMGWEPPKDYAADQAHGEALVTIASGDNGSVISKSLAAAGVTKTGEAFYDMLVKSGDNPTFYPGVYRLQKQMTAAAALAALLDPANKLENSALLREGLTAAQSIKILSDSLKIPLADFEAAVKTPAAYGVQADSLEGWLFPAMYTFDPGITAQQVIKTLVDRTVKSLDASNVAPADRQRVLTIASIIQREAREETDFYKVSRVIQNRLDQGMKLQMDSTAQYGYGELHDGTVSSSAAALADDNPWNTYVHTGLPQGPISNPGDTAIAAATAPTPGAWLYFVTVNLDTGQTVFSTTYAEHEKAVAQWQTWCKANPDSGC